MKAGIVLIYTLIFTFSLVSCDATTQSSCTKTLNHVTSIGVIKSNPIFDLEMTPLDKAFLLIGEAKIATLTTIAFIDDMVVTGIYKDVRDRLERCKGGYNSIKSNLKFDRSKLDTLEGRSDVIHKLDEVNKKVTYNCGGQQLSHDLPVVKELADRVHSFSDMVTAAASILKSIGQ